MRPSGSLSITKIPIYKVATVLPGSVELVASKVNSVFLAPPVGETVNFAVGAGLLLMDRAAVELAVPALVVTEIVRCPAAALAETLNRISISPELTPVNCSRVIPSPRFTAVTLPRLVPVMRPLTCCCPRLTWLGVMDEIVVVHPVRVRRYRYYRRRNLLQTAGKLP